MKGQNGVADSVAWTRADPATAPGRTAPHSILHDLQGHTDFGVIEVAPVQYAPAAQTTPTSLTPSVPLAAATILLADVAGFASAAAITSWLLVSPDLSLPSLAFAALTCVLLLVSEAVYPGYGIYPHELLRRRAMATVKGGVVTALALALLTGSWRLLGPLALFLILAVPLQWLLRTSACALLKRSGRWGMVAALLGPPQDVAAYREYFRDNPHLGIRDKEIADTNVRVALIAGPKPAAEALDRIRACFAEVILLADIPGPRRSGLRVADVSGEVGLRLRSDRPMRGAWHRIGRGLDLTLVAVILPVVLPVVLLAAIAVYVVDPGPVFYRQTREGLKGRTFQLWKLRTMYRDSEVRLQALLDTDAEARAEWAQHYKLRQDPRILPMVGNLLRGFSVDELPQLINVILGDMRIVGPRPFPLYHLDAMDAAFRTRRCSLVPGLTGLWQVSARSDADIGRQQDLDSFYIENRSFWYDSQIAFATISAVFRRDGAY